jgi:hypothetical protein
MADNDLELRNEWAEDKAATDRNDEHPRADSATEDDADDAVRAIINARDSNRDRC